MRSTKGKLVEFVIGVAGGTFLIAGILSLGSGSNMSKLWVVMGAIGILVARYLHRRSPRR